MKIILFYHSLISDWKNKNAHFLRGIYASLMKMGHDVVVFEPKNGWSLRSLIDNCGYEAVADYRSYFPHLTPSFYDPEDYDLNTMLQDADLVIVHEWNDPGLVEDIGKFKLIKDFTLLFHDTHHRVVSAKKQMNRYNLIHYDGVLTAGNVLSYNYERDGFHKNVWTWHEAADTDTYHPMIRDEEFGDVVWIGDWGNHKRTKEIYEFIIEPVKALNLKAKFYGAKYPKQAIQMLETAGIEYGGYLPTCKAAETFSKYKATIYVPEKLYREQLHGIPAIQYFEAMACKIPLISGPWEDTAELFTIGKDYLMAEDGEEMKDMLYKVMPNPSFARTMADHAYSTICKQHTCDHRAQELINIYTQVSEHKNIKMAV